MVDFIEQSSQSWLGALWSDSLDIFYVLWNFWWICKYSKFITQIYVYIQIHFEYLPLGFWRDDIEGLVSQTWTHATRKSWVPICPMSRVSTTRLRDSKHGNPIKSFQTWKSSNQQSISHIAPLRPLRIAPTLESSTPLKAGQRPTTLVELWSEGGPHSWAKEISNFPTSCLQRLVVLLFGTLASNIQKLQCCHSKPH